MNNYSQTIDPVYCSWDTTSHFLIYSDNVFGHFIYYSHLLPIVCLLLISALLLWQDSKNITVRWLTFMSLAFTAWSLTDLVLWATANPDHTMFFWSIIIHFELLVYIGSLYFIYNFILKKSLGWKNESLLLVAYLPLLLFAHTSLNLTGFDYTNCWREAIEGPLLTYAYALELIIALWILVFGVAMSRKKELKNRSFEILLATLGTVFFLISFSFGNIIGTLEVDWVLGQYGLFGIPVFAGLLMFLVVRYKSFNAKLLAAQALVLGILILITSILFVRQIEYMQVITLITAILTAILGYYLVKSVKREIKQREENEALAKNLAKVNTRLRELDKQKSEFVSIASHQLRSPLTAIRGYSSMILEGSYGPVPDRARESLTRIEESAKMMALSIEDYLNVSRIESGNMKYIYSDFNLNESVSKVCDDLRSEAMKQNLILLNRSDLKSRGIVHADVGKTHQIIHNLVNNSIKYTQKGSISVFVRDDLTKKRIYIDITDTGIGMSEKTQHTIFQKFERADGASRVNTSGTGLGLYVALKMAESMGGDITAHSEGDGKGSRFTIEMPLAM